MSRDELIIKLSHKFNKTTDCYEYKKLIKRKCMPEKREMLQFMS